MRHVPGERVRRKDEITSSHYLVFGGEIRVSNAIKQLTPGLCVNSSQLICMGVKSNQKHRHSRFKIGLWSALLFFNRGLVIKQHRSCSSVKTFACLHPSPSWKRRGAGKQLFCCCAFLGHIFLSRLQTGHRELVSSVITMSVSVCSVWKCSVGPLCVCRQQL